MSQVMTVERVDDAGFARTVGSLRRIEQPIKDPFCESTQIAAETCLRSSQYFELRQLCCEFQNGELIMRGQVSSFYMKQRAQERIRAVAGSIRIANLLEVVYLQRTPKVDERVGGSPK